MPSLPEDWILSAEDIGIVSTSVQFDEITNLLFERVQLNSTHLFRADILHDSDGTLRTVSEKEANYDISNATTTTIHTGLDHAQDVPPLLFDSFRCKRSVVRRLIPRKPQLDKALDQSCFIYNSTNSDQHILVVYVPHCQNAESMPWYHPKVKALAYRFVETSSTSAAISIYCLPFPETPLPLPERTQRTMESLLGTYVRLLKLPPVPVPTKTCSAGHDMTQASLSAAALKDTILPQHIVQDTYTRLKETYASDLMARWVEQTQPSKHVFEDLSIAAFLIELWNTMYLKSSFPGFMDIACGNGVLTYILIQEGWHGRGFDARRRKTWEALQLDEYLDEAVCIPKPFLDRSDTSALESMAIHNGVFPPSTFVISNHADELTCWTPILAALSGTIEPLPFLSIPCCSHALNGSKHRYTPKEVASGSFGQTSSVKDECTDVPSLSPEDNVQPATGDLRALRAQKNASHAHTDPADKSMYACLTRKTAAIAQELECDVELTLMRIPSTRNIGIVGNRKAVIRKEILRRSNREDGIAGDGTTGETSTPGNGDESTQREELYKKVDSLVARECSATDGVDASAWAWLQKAKKLQGGQGRGKVNWHGPPPPESTSKGWKTEDISVQRRLSPQALEATGQ